MNRVAKSSQPSRVSRWSAVGTITGERRPNVRQNDGGPPRLTQKSDTCQVSACVVLLRCRQIEEGTMLNWLGSTRSRLVAGVDDAQRPQDSSLSRSRRDQYELRQCAVHLRPSARDVQPCA